MVPDWDLAKTTEYA